jgi:hypothetical protein
MALNSSVVWLAGLFTPEAKIIDNVRGERILGTDW